jgi:hypothetical protein
MSKMNSQEAHVNTGNTWKGLMKEETPFKQQEQHLKRHRVRGERNKGRDGEWRFPFAIKEKERLNCSAICNKEVAV